MSSYSRSELAGHIVNALADRRDAAQREFRQPGRIPSFILDDLLPAHVALTIYQAFPSTEALVLKKTLGQLKYVGYQMSSYNPLLEEIIYAFQDPRVVKLISSITGIQQLLPDEHLYAGGISMMVEGHYLNPHLDNSHDLERNHYRVLNLLYYLTPDWRDEYGGNLELWDKGSIARSALCTAASTGSLLCRRTPDRGIRLAKSRRTGGAVVFRTITSPRNRPERTLPTTSLRSVVGRTRKPRT
jgi:Rps23 Pro-64 3,4-dihydroxylase Tpa1-like proline 4-hydroxylase